MTYIVGEFEEGTRWAERALEEFRRIGDDAAVGHMLFRLAVEAHRSGDRARARTLCEEGLALDRSAFGRMQALSTLANLAFDDGKPEEALDLLKESARLAGGIGFSWFQSHALLTRAEYALTLGALELGRAALREGVEVAGSIGDRQWLVWGVTLAAWLAVAEGRDAEAGRLWGALEAEAERAPIGQWEGERDTWSGRIVRTSPEFELGREAGWRLTLDKAVAEVVADA
jgi:tetratricopeptide (TPR) repeat protein